MANIDKLIVAGTDNALSFGNHEAVEKQKQEGFELEGDLYKVKTHQEITRLEKNGKLLYESVPGTTVKDLIVTSELMTFAVVSGAEDAQITVELETEEDYKILINQVQVGKVTSNLAGKISFSVDFASGEQSVEIRKL